MTERSSKTQNAEKLVLDLVVGEYRREWERLNALDSKAAMLLGFGTIVATISIAFFSLAIENLFAPSCLFMLLPIVVLISVILYVSGTILALIASYVRAFEAVPRIDDMLKIVHEKNVVLGLAESYRNYVEVLIRTNNYKADILKGSFVVFAFGVLSTLVTTVVIVLLVN